MGNLSREDLIRSCEEYLRTCHISVWGQSYDMFQADSRLKAATWLAEQITNVAIQTKRGDEVDTTSSV